MCDYPRITVYNSHENTSKYVDKVTLFAKTWTKGHWPLDDLWPHMRWGHMCDYTQGSLCPIPMKIHQSMWIQWLFLQKHNQRSLTPRWPLTPHLLRSHVWLYPRSIVSKSHENTSKYVDSVNLFEKTWNKGHWPLDDLWPTSVEVTCVTLPKDHCVHVPWEYINVCGYSDQFCKWPHEYYIRLPQMVAQVPHVALQSLLKTKKIKGNFGAFGAMWHFSKFNWEPLYYILHTTYILRTTYIGYYIQNEWSHSLFLNTVQARQKSYNELNVTFQWDKQVLELSFEHTKTLNFHSRTLVYFS